MGMCSASWVLRDGGAVFHNGEEVARAKEVPQEGDIVSVSYDHVELNFFLNGKSLDCPVHSIRGSVYPTFYVDEGAILDVAFLDFTYPPPDGFDRIMFEKSLI